MNNIDHARQALEAANHRLEVAVSDALAAGISVDDVAQALVDPAAS